MNKQEYEKIRFNSWIGFCKEHPIETPSMSIGEAFAYAFDRAYALGRVKKPISQEDIENEAVDYAFDENKKRHDARPDTAPEYACEDLIDAFKAGANFVLGMPENDADEAEMLTVSRKRVQNLYNYHKSRGHHLAGESLIKLFGSKCLPDENSSKVERLEKNEKVDSSEPKPAEPKFKVGDKIRIVTGGVFYDRIGEVTDIDFVGHLAYYKTDRSYEWLKESDLEPYTEPEKREKEGKTGEKLENSQSDRIANCDNQFDTIIKDSFRNERRLNIAAMAMQGILGTPVSAKSVMVPGNMEISELTLAEKAVKIADALIAECDKYISVEKLKHILRALVAEGAIEPITMSIDEIINKIKKSI